MRYVTTLKEDSSIIFNGDRCITNIQELYTSLLDKETTEIVLTVDFVEKYFTLNGLQNFIENAQIINADCRIVIDEVFSMFNADLVQQLSELRTREDFINALCFREKDILDTVSMLCDYYRSSQKDSIAASNKIATLHLMLSRAEKSLEDKDKDYKNLLDVRNEYEMKLKTLVDRINYNYDKDVNSNSLTQVTGHRYEKVLYIKEITRINYTDTLIYYLQESLKVMYNVPCRLLVIEPFYAYKNCKLYDRCKPSYDLTKQDVYSNDIVMAGFQPNLVTDIIHNPSHMHYLIILDRGGYAVPHIYGKNIDLIYTVSDLKDLEKLEITADNDHIISYSEDTLNIPYIDNFDEISIEEKMRLYTSMDITQKLISLLEGKA